MSVNIERLLRLTADYHRFCDESCTKAGDRSDPDELEMEELELIAAAGNGYFPKDVLTE